MRGLLPKLAAAGFDAIEAITPKPGGDLEVEEICDLAGDSPVILWGGVPGVLFAPPFTWADMRRHVLRVLASWGSRPFILGIADQVPPTATSASAGRSRNWSEQRRERQSTISRGN